MDSKHQGRAGGVDELLKVEAQTLPLGWFEIAGLALLQEKIGGQQVHVLDRPIERVCLPFRRLEPLVARPLPGFRGRPGHARPACAEAVPGLDGRGPHLHVQIDGGLEGPCRVGCRPQPHRPQRSQDFCPVDRHDVVERVGVPHCANRAQDRVLIQHLCDQIDVRRRGIPGGHHPLRCWVGRKTEPSQRTHSLDHRGQPLRGRCFGRRSRCGRAAVSCVRRRRAALLILRDRFPAHGDFLLRRASGTDQAAISP